MQPRRQSTPVEGLPLFHSFRVLDVEIDGLCHSPSRPGEQIIHEWVFVDRLLELLGTGRCQNGSARGFGNQRRTRPSATTWAAPNKVPKTSRSGGTGLRVQGILQNVLFSRTYVALDADGQK